MGESLSRGGLLSKLIVVVWGGALLMVTSSLMVGHWVTLPHPATGTTIGTLVSQPTGGLSQVTDPLTEMPIFDGSSKRIFAFHFLYGDCPCSRRVLRTIVDRDPVHGVSERIVLIGDDPELKSKAIARGFEVETVTPDELKDRYGVDAAPLLLVANSNGLIQYSGGYTSRKQGLDVSDVSIIHHIVNGQTVEELPLYGCAVSDTLKSIIDPLGLK